MSIASPKSSELTFNAVHQGDCIQQMARLPAGCIDLAFADPPFNIGYKYDVYDDRQAADDYLAWCREWIASVYRVLKPDGAFWLAIGDEFAAELKVMAQREVGFHTRSWVIWYYTFGVNCKRKFSRSHAHLFYFVKHPERFTFNADDPAIRIPSARQLVYADGRANPRGRLPDDTWILRPQDLEHGFAADSDTWYFPRVAGTFKERAGFHGCQMPEQLLGRIVRACSHVGDVVLDPFAGSGTTLAVAKKLERKWVGFELSPEYVTKVRSRLNGIAVGQALDGAEDPLRSAPATQSVQAERVAPKPHRSMHMSATSVKRDLKSRPVAPPNDRPNCRTGELDNRQIVCEAYRLASQGWSTERVIADPELQAAFVDHCIRLGAQGGPGDWNRSLMRLRKAGDSGLNATRRESTAYEEVAPMVFGSEVAWKQLAARGLSLDDILCDPITVEEFDRLAARYSPGHSKFRYRWGALYLRKRAKKAINGIQNSWRLRFGSLNLLLSDNRTKPLGVPGLYQLRRQGKSLFIGDTPDLHATAELVREYLRSKNSPLHGLDELIGLALPGDGLLTRLSKRAKLVASICPDWNLNFGEGGPEAR